MNVDKITKQLENVLTEDEEIEKIFSLTGRNVIATNKRLVELKGNTTIDYDYSHISSIEYSSRRSLWALILGIVIVIAAFYFSDEIPRLARSGLPMIGGILILGGLLYKRELVKIHVVGVPDTVEYEGARTTLESLFNIVRKKHFASKKDID